MKKKIILIIISVLAILFISSILTIFYNLSPVDRKSDKNIEFVIKPGWGKNKIVSELKNNNLIRSSLFSKIYLKLNDNEIYAGTFKLSKDMSTNEIFLTLMNERNIENRTVNITFVEGKKITYYAKMISKNFDYTENEILTKLNDKSYLNDLIDSYWFLTNDILNDNIYYPLEGYLYPDTYEFKKDSTIEEIVKKILNNTDKKLSDYKSSIELSNYSINQIMTMASIVELEGKNDSDRATVAGVFYNRLNKNMTLGSDVTTYYGVKKDFDKELTQSDLNSCNSYNTRGTCVTGLPIGPICNAGLASITAAIEPTASNYLFFVADNEGKTYFSETSIEHEKIVSTLKSEGKWYTY